MRKISTIVYKKLAEYHVKNVFLYSGGAIMPLIDQFHQKFNDHEINYFIHANEFCLCSAAVGYAKISDEPGICITTSGPGLTNCVTPIVDAQNDSVPLIVISGQVPIKAMGTNAFQEAPSVDITKSITKWNYCLKDKKEVNDVLDFISPIMEKKVRFTLISRNVF